MLTCFENLLASKISKPYIKIFPPHKFQWLLCWYYCCFKNYKFWSDMQFCHAHTKFHEYPSVFQNVLRGKIHGHMKRQMDALVWW